MTCAGNGSRAGGRRLGAVGLWLSGSPATLCIPLQRPNSVDSVAPSRRPGPSSCSLGAGAMGAGVGSGETGTDSGGRTRGSAGRRAEWRDLRRGRACPAGNRPGAVRLRSGCGPPPAPFTHGAWPDRGSSAFRPFASPTPDVGPGRRGEPSPVSDATTVDASNTTRTAETPATTNRARRERRRFRHFSSLSLGSTCDGATFSSLIALPVRSSSSFHDFSAGEPAAMRSWCIVGSSADIYESLVQASSWPE